MRIGRGYVRIERLRRGRAPAQDSQCILVALALMPARRRAQWVTRHRLGLWQCAAGLDAGRTVPASPVSLHRQTYDAHPVEFAAPPPQARFQSLSSRIGADLFRSSWLHCCLLLTDTCFEFCLILALTVNAVNRLLIFIQLSAGVIQHSRPPTSAGPARPVLPDCLSIGQTAC